MDTERQTIPELLQAEHDKTVSETVLYYSDAIEEYTEILHHYSGYISSANSVEKKYLRYMTKSALYAEIDRVDNFMQSLRNLALLKILFMENLTIIKKKFRRPLLLDVIFILTLIGIMRCLLFVSGMKLVLPLFRWKKKWMSVVLF